MSTQARVVMFLLSSAVDFVAIPRMKKLDSAEERCKTNRHHIVAALRQTSASVRRSTDALAIMRDLRARDVWDRAQTHDSLRPYLNEEMHELDDAIRSRDDQAMRSELGDVLLQVLFHAIIAEERGAFDAASVAGSLVAKMTKRHPWLYQTADGGRRTTEREPWEQMKSKTRKSLLPMWTAAQGRCLPCTARTGCKSVRLVLASTGPM